MKWLKLFVETTRTRIWKCRTDSLNCLIRVKRLPEKGERFIHHNERKTNKKVSEALAYHVIMERLRWNLVRSPLRGSLTDPLAGIQASYAELYGSGEQWEGRR